MDDDMVDRGYLDDKKGVDGLGREEWRHLPPSEKLRGEREMSHVCVIKRHKFVGVLA
jgi:hypothetical protein